jgi:putative spermidine/putrescine transport system substrate-binding protein
MSKSLLARLATVVVSTALALTAMTTGVSAQKAEITFFDVCSGANFQQFFNKILPLAQKELGFKINYAPGRAPELQMRLLAGQANQHVILSNEFVVADFLTAGIDLVDLDAHAAKIPNMSMVEDSERATVVGIPTKGRGTPFWRHQLGIIYNTAKIPNPPKTWQEYVERRAEWAGHIGMVRPDAGPPPGRYMLYDFLRGFGVDENLPLAELQATPEYKNAIETFKTFSESFYKPAFNAPPLMFAKYGTGDVWIGELPIDFALWSRDQGLLPETVQATFFPTPLVNGACWTTVPANVSKDQQQSAFALINWLLSIKTQGRMLTEMHQYPAISAWDKMPKGAFDDIPTWEEIAPIRKPLVNNDLFNWIKENGADLLAK